VAQIPVDTRYWEMKWEKTCGYLVFKEQFSAMDVNNARFRYQRKKDDDFPITFDKTSFTIINNRITENIGEDLFWAAVIAPTQAFFENDWRSYAPRGEEFRTIQLAKFINNEKRVEHLPPEKRDIARMKAADKLLKLGIGYSNRNPIESHIPEPKLYSKTYTAEEDYSEEEVFDALDDIFEEIE
jgi:hypothetical protein